MVIETQQSFSKARLFTLRVWVVKQEEAVFEWRARLQDTQSGDVSYFRDWQDLSTSIEKIIRNQNGNSAEKPKESL